MPPASPSARVDTAFETIEATVMQTARGRAFLAEFARRNRTAETEMLLGALGKLESALAGPTVGHDLAQLRSDLASLDGSLAGDEAAGTASAGLIDLAETSTSNILDAAEAIQEAAWVLRESGADPALCDRVDIRATEIYAACAFQDLATRRFANVVRSLRSVETILSGFEGPSPAAGDPKGQRAIAADPAAPSEQPT